MQDLRLKTARTHRRNAVLPKISQFFLPKMPNSSQFGKIFVLAEIFRMNVANLQNIPYLC
ncbi:MAG: hypothetical protein IK053_01220 [Muribaculaceae bacterium]|nr:hypothetical protein [Muribaculaceae bacterium]